MNNALFAKVKKHWTEEELDKKVVSVNPMSPTEEKEVYDMLVRCRIQVTLGYPFFGYLSMHLDLQPDYTIETAATDGSHFFYNPYFIKALSEPERSWIIVHEVMHAALKHLWRRGSRNHEKWNYACDYTIHSIIMQFLNQSNSKRKGSLRMPKNCLYNSKYDDMSAEQIYEILPDNYKEAASFGQVRDKSNGGGGSTPLDDHSRWDNQSTQNDSNIKQRTWDGRLVSAAQVASSKNAGNLPGFLQRLVNKITRPQKDWRTLLAEFVETVNDDYSFNPPDNRYDEKEFGGIMLPAFNDQTEVCKNIIFWIDTSGSIGNKELRIAYSEIVGAIEQFRGKLTGKLGFFDSMAYPLTDFDDVEDVVKIKPQGGGGTDFDAPLIYVKDKIDESEVAGIIMLTDGYCDWPDEKLANDKPVLWLINNEERVPPWGKHATLDVNQEED